MNTSKIKQPTYRILLSLLYRSRWALAIAVFASIANGISSVSLITLINKAVTTANDSYSSLAWYFGILAVLAIACRILSGVIFAKLSQNTMAKMRELISERVTRAPFRQIEVLGASRAQSIITDDATNVSLLFFTLPNIVMQGSIVLGCLGYLAWLSWPVFFLALAIVIIGSLGYSLGGTKAINSFNAAGKAQDRLFSHFNALFSGAKELKLHFSRTQAFFTNSLGHEIDAVRQHRTRAFGVYAFGAGWILFLFYMFLGLVIFAPTVIPGLEVTTLAGYVIIFLFMLMPLDGLLNSIPALNAARVSLNRIGNVLSELNEQDQFTQQISANEFGEATLLRLSGLTHSYYREKEDKVFQLGPIDMKLKRGEITFLIGGNGSGKTTLAKLLVGLYTPENGTITVDGHVITDNNRANYRQLFSAVFSDFYLFETLMGLSDTDSTLDSRANELLTKLHLDHKVKIENGCFSTRDLSLGQRKRLALVVAYLEDRPFYLFDEWAADQDPLFKTVFYQELLPELAARGKAVLAITHDDRFFHLADHCIKLESGRLLVN
ncbi:MULTISPECIES: cyclic peptide export ABC transporter [Photorhabdus]|uniref:Peptide ABC transporter ATP-binding protein n=1 Tax=Photorhabdus thracensis TaxID=230089 RepID=A0A0F7LHQ8_9GAMM|nr:cyclic peptide export ABC transporter [Photorhabdus thracensis]AKH62654.1 peptide ABC transporter ATP-binding protein [Photorhabdus thracensis]MCC8421776.1 cyclic peptide export ABC transporter [Photorhabdus thracensis]